MGEGAEFVVTGIVQGVGFRPFVWRLAQRLRLAGEVRNAGDHVVIRAFGPAAALDAFEAALAVEAPPLARVNAVRRTPCPAAQPEGFRIVESAAGAVSVGVVPDVATCPACRAEIADPAARRFRYAFTNCTDCGPRFSIVRGLPYDRARTTMAGCALCPACRAEYEDPADRRFHAQPVACPACGPRLWLEDGEGAALPWADPVAEAARRLAAGGILAVKGIGGFHIAFYVDDVAAAKAYLDAKGVKTRMGPIPVSDGPAAGQTILYFQAPWGLQLEAISYPNGMAYEKGAETVLWSPKNPDK